MSLEAVASVTVSGGTISAADGDLALPWLGQLGNFFAIGMHHALTFSMYGLCVTAVGSPVMLWATCTAVAGPFCVDAWHSFA